MALPLSRRNRYSKGAFLALFAGLAGWLLYGNTLAIALESATPSQSAGTPSHGRLAHGKRMPTSGPNFRAYSRLGAAVGRNAVHSRVRTTVLDAYAELERTVPEMQFVYGETGWPSGGRFRPHRTHQNGLSVDFMVPVRTRAGAPSKLPTWPWNKFGYGIEFDSAGRWQDLVIDFPALAKHLGALDPAAGRNGLRIERVILAPELMAQLGRSPEGAALVQRLPFMRGRAWVRHDEHYHVDFAPIIPWRDRS